MVAAVAAWMGVKLPQHEDAEQAKAACQRVIDSGDVDEAPRAASRLGDLLKAGYRPVRSSL